MGSGVEVRDWVNDVTEGKISREVVEVVEVVGEAGLPTGRQTNKIFTKILDSSSFTLYYTYYKTMNILHVMMFGI